MPDRKVLPRTLGWEIVEQLEQERPSAWQRLAPAPAEIRAALVGVAVFFALCLLGAWLAGNPLPATQRIASPLITKLGWQGSDHWQVFWWVVVLTMIFEFLDAAAGMGYGTAITPLLLVLGFVPKQIVPVVMLQQGAAGLVGTFLHQEFKNVEWRLRPLSETVRLWLYIAGLGCAAVTFSITSVYAWLKLANVWISLYVALLLVMMGGLSLFIARRERPYRPKRMILIGALAGFNKGIGGGGYGPVVTIGGILAGVPVKSMLAVTALSEGTVCVASTIVWLVLLARGEVIDFILLPSMMLGSMLAAVLAPYCTRVVAERTWRWLVPAYSLILAAYVCYQAIPAALARLG